MREFIVCPSSNFRSVFSLRRLRRPEPSSCHSHQILQVVLRISYISRSIIGRLSQVLGYFSTILSLGL